MKVTKRLIWKLIAFITSPAMNISQLNEEAPCSAADSTESSSTTTLLTVSVVMVDFNSWS